MMRRVLFWIFAVPVALYVVVCFVAWFFQDRLVWYPGPPPTSTPAAIGLAFEDLDLHAADGALVHAWHVKAEHPRGIVVVCHGNAGSIEDRLHLAQVLHGLGYDVLLFDYRQYGQSRGTLSEEGTYLDGMAALDHAALCGFDARRTVLYGESLGGAVAIELAQRRACAVVVVEDAFTSLADAGSDVYPWLPVRWITRPKYASIDKVREMRTPLLVVHSPEDRLVTFEHGRRLHAAHPGPKSLLETSGAHGGGGFLLRAEWVEALRQFLASHIAEK